jgi:hypothetical protein
MAILSSAYLASSPFQKSVDNDKIIEFALSGYYGLQDYAVSSLQDHISRCLEQRAQLPSQTTQDLLNVLRAISKRLDLDFRADTSFEDFANMKNSLESNGLEHLTQRLEQLSSAVRRTTETIQPTVLDVRTRGIFLSLNGPPQYKCPKPRCLLFSHGFENKKARDLHAAQHYSQFTCSADGCPRQNLGFTSHLDLERHAKQEHLNLDKNIELFPTSKKPKDVWSACKRGEIEFVKDFYERGGDLQSTPEKKSRLTSIVLAARNGHLDLCQYLVRNGCTVFKARNGFQDLTALGEAIKSRNKVLFEFFLNGATEKETSEFINGKSLIYHIASAMNSGERYILDAMLSLNSRRRKQIPCADIFYHALKRKSARQSDVLNLYEYLFSIATAEEVSTILTKPVPNASNNYMHLACAYKMRMR